jgi:uncharacterized protein YhaN
MPDEQQLALTTAELDEVRQRLKYAADILHELQKPHHPTLTPDELDTLALPLRDQERLLAEVDHLRADNAALREIAEALEEKFTATATGTCDPCPWCYADQDYEPHERDCPVTKARALRERAGRGV